MKRILPPLAALVFLLPPCTSAADGRGTIHSILFPYIWKWNIDPKGKMEEPSGIVYHPLRKTLFVVGDGGHLYEITPEGKLLSKKRLKGDLEGITWNPQNGMLYICEESKGRILEYDPGAGAVRRKFKLDRSFGGRKNFLSKGGEGIEGISFVPDPRNPEGGTFYVTHQYDPPMLIEVEVPIRSGGKKARILRAVSLPIFDLSDVIYLPDNKRLYVLSDAANLLLEVSLKGEITGVWALPGNEQEGLAFDGKGNAYIAQDTGGVVRYEPVGSAETLIQMYHEPEER